MITPENARRTVWTGDLFLLEVVTCDLVAVSGHSGFNWASAMTSVLSRACLAGMMMVLLALAYAGCGPSSLSDGPKTENQARDEKKIQELSRKGYDFSEIRSIMKGEQPKFRPKKKARIARR
jgi:hypothetical protein